MKKFLRLLCAAAVLGALGLLPFRPVDVAKLLPVKTIIVTRSGEEYEVDVGAGVRAAGRTLQEALALLREELSGEIFLPTAEQVILTEPAEDAVEAVVTDPAFRPAAGIYRTPDRFPDANAIGVYLESHPSNTTVKDVRAALAEGRVPELPRIRAADGGWRVDA